MRCGRSVGASTFVNSTTPVSVVGICDPGAGGAGGTYGAGGSAGGAAGGGGTGGGSGSPAINGALACTPDALQGKAVATGGGYQIIPLGNSPRSASLC